MAGIKHMIRHLFNIWPINNQYPLISVLSQSFKAKIELERLEPSLQYFKLKTQYEESYSICIRNDNIIEAIIDI